VLQIELNLTMIEMSSACYGDMGITVTSHQAERIGPQSRIVAARDNTSCSHLPLILVLPASYTAVRDKHAFMIGLSDLDQHCMRL
jgi:hypothetical protein